MTANLVRAYFVNASGSERPTWPTKCWTCEAPIVPAVVGGQPCLLATCDCLNQDDAVIEEWVAEQRARGLPGEIPVVEQVTP